jgi:CRP-like cAMP-binding protein
MLHRALPGSLITTYDQGTEENQLLGMLPASSYFRIRPYLEVVSLHKRQIVWHVDDPIDFVYFPRRCVLSLLVPLAERTPIEAATVGNEGLVGASIALGAEHAPLLVMVQIPGEALRIGARLFSQLTDDDASLRLLTLRYSQALFEQTAQSVACNRRHSTVQRCARWLLMTHDRAHATDFALTHQFLAMMLGVRRSSVTVAAGQLQRARLIRYLYGRVVVENRRGLEEAACECYHVVQRRFQRLFRTPPSNGDGASTLVTVGAEGNGRDGGLT